VELDELHELMFRRGSRTFSNASKLFPKAVRRDVRVLYAFVRLADNLVDDPPVHPDEFYALRQRWRDAWAGRPAGDWIVDPFVELGRRKGFDPSWVESFLDAMESDLTARPCDSLEDVLRYTWGSAEVIGLFMMRILDLAPEAQETACLMGRSMQFINFLRDIAEDHGLGRRYLPLTEGWTDLSAQAAQADPEGFRRYLATWLPIYREWQTGAAQGYAYLPWRYRWAVKTASDLYNWTALVIEKHPLEVWKRKIKPSRWRILATALRNLLALPLSPRNRVS
jgi:phytoene synthase